MSIRDPRMSEVNDWAAVAVVVCDECPRILDILDRFWYFVVVNHYVTLEDGTTRPMELYQGEHLCWKCREKRNENSDT